MNKIIVLTVIVGNILLLSCSNNGSADRPGMMAQGGDYKVMELNPVSVTTHSSFPATIQGQQVIEIRPKVDGYIEEIKVKEGASVSKGQLLFRISNPQYDEALRTAEASVKIAEANVKTAQMNVNKVIPLVEKEIVSEYELQSAQYTLQSQEAALAQAKADFANAQANLNYTFIKSPLDGVIGTIPYKMGALVSSSSADPLTTLSDISYVHVYFSFNEKQILSLLKANPGKKLQDVLNNMDDPSLVLADETLYSEKGKLETASGLVSTETGSVSMKAIFPNPDGILRSGASATLKLPSVVDSALLVPQSATYEVLDKRFVYTVTTGNIIKGVAFESTPTDDGQYFIATDGLKPGDKIVLEGIISLKDNMQINPVVVSADINKTLSSLSK